MTQKHFEAIAKALREHRPRERKPTSLDHILWASLVMRIADVCAEANPRFNTRKFVSACYQDVGLRSGVDNTTPVR